MRSILVSGCLYGWNVRYDGQSRPCLHPLFLKWKTQGRLVPVCPEVYGGLPVPRPPAQRRGDRIVTQTGADVTEAYEKGARWALRLAKERQVVCAIFKQGSPSCGSAEIYDGSFTGRKISGTGLAAEYLQQAGVPVFDETQIALAARLLED